MATAKELQNQANAARVLADRQLAVAQTLADQARAAERAEAAQRRADELIAHSNLMFDKLGYELNAKQHEIIYAKALEMGNGDFDDETENYYSDLADLVRQCLGSASYL